MRRPRAVDFVVRPRRLGAGSRGDASDRPRPGLQRPARVLSRGIAGSTAASATRRRPTTSRNSSPPWPCSTKLRGGRRSRGGGGADQAGRRQHFGSQSGLVHHVAVAETRGRQQLRLQHHRRALRGQQLPELCDPLVLRLSVRLVDLEAQGGGDLRSAGSACRRQKPHAEAPPAGLRAAALDRRGQACVRPFSADQPPANLRALRRPRPLGAGHPT
mmetsp:Transcript_127168/g.365754  ORF Transcript_127168/g.365754 Transcript_127168/m.365754 type:complete len:216 (+) Transcript_127168:94-741(+)